MTPVEDTSTCSTGQPTRSAAVTAMSRASVSPRAPVQALAQPLLTTTAAVVPSDRRRCSRVTVTGAATARLVVKMPADRAGGVDASSARSSPDGLMPQATPAARKPAGAVIPPGMRSSMGVVSGPPSAAGRGRASRPAR